MRDVQDEDATLLPLDLSLVIDIGKSNAKLLLIDAAGSVVEQHSRANASVASALGYPALDVQGLQAWMQATLRASRHARRCGHVIASTHGAALVALGQAGLAWEPLDYEFEGVTLQGAAATAFQAASGSFAETLSPELPAGLNAARQLEWLQNTHAQHWRQTTTLLPYAQYWAWLLSGVACSEVSSLGCHTHLWNPAAATWSSLAVSRGWATLFAPLRPAWEVIGTLGEERGAAWGLPAACQVHAGVHDSNACLARYLENGSAAEALTIVSSGTWTVLMAPGAAAQALDAAKDMLGNVDVTGRMTPTARFMGGREFAVLLDGASPQAASLQTLRSLIAQRVHAFPSFAQQGGPFAGRSGYLERDGLRLQGPLADHLNEAERATLAAAYCAQLTAWLVDYLWGNAGSARKRVVVEGPLANNPVYLQLLQALLPGSQCQASSDAVEGTARGAWLLSRWHGAVNQREAGTGGAEAVAAGPSVRLQAVEAADLPGLKAWHAHWLSQL
jgi:sugar (pentulose or hexulose) kinase